MKKLAIVLSVAMILAIAAPAMAADVKLSGSLDASAGWTEKGGFDSAQTSKLNLGINAGENVKAVIEFGGFESEKALGEDFDPIQALSISKAYLEAKGELWNGSNEVTARIGDLDVQYSPYVATTTNDGIHIDGIQAGPVQVGGFYTWNAGALESQGLNVAGSVQGINMKGTVVKDEAADNYDWAVEGDTLVVDGVQVSAAYAANQANAADMYRVDANVQATDNLKIMAGYRSVDQAFAPIFAEKTEDGDGNPTDWVRANQGDEGFNVGFQTTQAGVDLTAMYDDPDKLISFDAATERYGAKLTAGLEMNRDAETIEFAKATFGAERDFAVAGETITASYNATKEAGAALVHELGAKATINAIPQLQGLAVEGNVEVTGTELSDYTAKASYTAPNGLNLGVGYNKTDGANVNAGMTVEF